MPSNPDSLSKVDPAYALERIELVLAGYPNARPHDPDRYIQSLQQALTEFPKAVVDHVTSARTGIQTRCQYLPKLPEVRTACDSEMERLRKQYRHAMAPVQRRKEIEEEARLAEQKKSHLTLDALKSKYGGSFLPPVHDPQRDALLKRMEERDQRANTEFIEREYALHGLKPAFWKGVLITLSTARMMQDLGKLTIERVS